MTTEPGDAAGRSPIQYPDDAPDPVGRVVRRYAGDELPLFVLGVVAGVLGRGASLVPPVALGIAIDAVVVGGSAFSLPFVPAAWLPADRLGQLAVVVGLMLAALVVGGGLGWVQGVSLSLFSNRVQHALRTDTYDAVQRLDVAFFDDAQTGQVLTVLDSDVRNLRWFLGTTVGGALQLVATLLVVAAVLVSLNPGLAVVTLLVVPFLAAFTVWFMRRIRPLYRALRHSNGALTAQLENNVTGIEVIMAAGAEPHEAERIGTASWDYYLRSWGVSRLEHLYQPTVDFFAGIAFVLTVLVGGYWLVVGPPAPFSGTLMVGEFVTFLLMSQRFVDPLSGVGRIVNSYENARSSAERVFALVDRSVDVTDPETPVDHEIRGRIEYDGVGFAYRPDVPVLDGLSFVADTGETVAFVGPTGAGKSTAAKLLLRFYDATEGRITVDGVDVRDLPLSTLRAAIGYVGQDVFLFDGTVRENVTYGSFDATDDEVVAACAAAGAHAFVESLPDGYDTLVGERGVKLSGGQRQRLSIARAMLQDPKILVLDEATSAVDTETELQIRRGLESLTAGRTTLAIAHRLSTVKDADRIVVLDGGRPAETGTHEELLDADGIYADLWRAQTGDYDAVSAAFRERVERSLAAVDD